MSFNRNLATLSRAGWRTLRLFLVILVGYLLQVCFMPFIKIGGVTPSIILAFTAVITVCYGRMRAFWAGGLYGIMLEAMVPTRPLFSLMVYPIAALLCSTIFADRSPQTLEYQRALGKAGRNVNPYARTIGCAAANTLIHEIVNIAYVYLRDGELTRGHIQSGILAVFLTTMLTILIMVPLRRLFGFKHQRPEKKQPKLYQSV